ncbi:hypothetical protein [Kribbella steppae]|nr:hypothetical protein [Kribbella steppae]
MNERSELIIKHCPASGGAAMSDVVYLAVTVVVFSAVWFALRGVEKL